MPGFGMFIQVNVGGAEKDFHGCLTHVQKPPLPFYNEFLP